MRVALAGVVTLALVSGEFSPGSVLAYAGAGLAAGLGVLLMLGRPRAVAREDLVHVLVDALAAGLLVAGTGGGGSPFLALYFPAAVGVIRVPEPTRAVAGSVGLAGSYLGAIYLTGGLDAAAAVVAASILLVCGIAGGLGAEMKNVREERSSLSSTLSGEHDYEEKVAGLTSELGRLLGMLSREGILRWSAGTARELTGAPYAHAAVLDSNQHRTSAGDEHESYPIWWHPEIQRLVLWSARERMVHRSGGTVGAIENLVAFPVVSESGEPWGAVVLGGKSFSAAEERALTLLASRTAAALEESARAPGGRDPVSGLPGYASLQRELSSGRAAAVVMADLDGLRRYNRAYGLAGGDDLLREIGQRLREGRQPAFRCGGDEIALLLTGSNGARSREVALGLQRIVAELTAGSLAPLTATTGYTTTTPEERDPDRILAAAGRAVSRAKGGTRDAGELAEPAYQALDELEHTLESPLQTNETVLALVEAAEVRAPSLGTHMRAVSRLTERLGIVIGLSPQDLDALVAGALLHDIGKIGILDSIMLKADSLTGEEYEDIKRHPVLGAKILEHIEELAPALPAVKHHHERFDGGGYPDGLAGEEIPLAARITLVADALDSMTRDRPYRLRLPMEAALEEIRRNSGTQFDPDAVAALQEILRQDGEEQASS